MFASDFILKDYNTQIQGGVVQWQSPSNIALVKYWGKKENQIPANPSISFTLSHCKTITKITFSKKRKQTKFSFDIYLEGIKNNDFKPKIQIFFERVLVYIPFVETYHFKIETSNTFPHSSGIASSASGMSALALCLMSIEIELTKGVVLAERRTRDEKSYFVQKSSFLARLGSGSACRSIEGPLVIWGKNNAYIDSSDVIGTKLNSEIHPIFTNFHDAILLVHKNQKQVSSSTGHELMQNHPYAKQRFKHAHQNISNLKSVLKTGNVKRFIEIVESEALTLHAMMMTSMPYFILMKPNTLKIINKIWDFRKKTGTLVCFTLDAGANVHVLFPNDAQQKVYEFINNQLVAYCENGHYICDKVGLGAVKLPITETDGVNYNKTNRLK